MHRIEVLKKHLQFLSVKEIGEYAARHGIYVRRYAKGETVYQRADECVTLDFVESGSLIAYALSENGSAMTMFEFNRGSILGANLLFAENSRYPLNIYCLSDCELVHIDQQTVSELLRNYDFVLLYIKSLSRNSQGQNQKINMLFQKTLRENIMDYLKMQSVIQKSSTILLPISKKELADYLGVQRSSLFRELKKMKDECLIDIQNRTVIIL